MSTPVERKSSGKKTKDTQKQSSRKKRSRRTSSESSLEEQSREGKDGVVVAEQEIVVDKDSREETKVSQSEKGDTPAIKRRSRGSKKSPVRDTAEDLPLEVSQESTSKAVDGTSEKRVLRSRGKGGAGSKGKSVTKKIKLEESGEPLACVSEQSSDVPQSVDKQQEGIEEESEISSEVASESKRFLRKRKQTSSGGSGGSSSKRVPTGRKTIETDKKESDDTTQSSPAELSSEVNFDSAKPNSESTGGANRDTDNVDDGDEKSEELIVRVSTSLTKIKKDSRDTEGEVSASKETVNETKDQIELALNEGEPPSLVSSAPSASNDNSGQSSNSGDQTPPPPTSQPDPSSSVGDPPSISSCDKAAATAEGGEKKKESENDKVEEPPKKIDSSQLPPTIQIRAGMSLMVHSV